MNLNKEKILPIICLMLPVIAGIIFAAPYIWQLIDQWMNFNEFTIMVTPVICFYILMFVGGGILAGLLLRGVCKLLISFGMKIKNRIANKGVHRTV